MTCKMCEMPSFFALGLNLGGVGSLPCFTTMNLLAVGREFSWGVLSQWWVQGQHGRAGRGTGVLMGQAVH